MTVFPTHLLKIFGRPGAHEEVWSLGEQSILPDSPHMGDQVRSPIKFLHM